MADKDIDFQQIQIERAALERAAHLHFLHWLILILSLAITFGAWHYAKNQVESRALARFESNADQVIELVLERMQKYEDVLWSGVAMVDALGEDLAYPVWKDYATKLEIEHKYPGINGIGVIHHVLPGARESYLAAQRRYRPDYTIHPAHGENVYLPITYIEPELANAQAVGLDMAHEQNRYNAAVKARDSGKAQITGPIILVQDAERTPGFLFFAPFYEDDEDQTRTRRRNNFAGMVYAPFVVKKLMAGTLEKEKRLVRIKINDGDDILYDEHVDKDVAQDDTRYVRTQTIDLYGRNWTFTVRATDAFLQAAHTSKPALILVGGIFIDGLLLTLFILLTSANRRALRFADRVTQGYREKTSKLSSMNDRLAHSNKELESFAYIASHDLKSPVRHMGVTADLINKMAGDKLEEQEREMLNIMLASAQKSQKMIDSLLQYARIGQGEGDFEHILLNMVIAEALANLEAEVKANKAEFTVNALPDVEGNAALLVRLFQNLIQNSIKYARKGVSPIIEISAARVGDYWHIRIADNGISVDPAYEDKIFKMFQRLHHDGDGYGGSGIGLAVCKKIALYHDGDIWLDSSHKDGAAFIIKLPVRD